MQGTGDGSRILSSEQDRTQSGGAMRLTWSSTSALSVLVALASASPAEAMVRIQEVLLSCRDGFQSAAFVELVATSPSTRLTSRTRLRFLNADGSIRMDIGLGVSSSAPLHGEGRTYLLALPTFEGATGVHPDTLLPTGPATSAGRIRLVDIHPQTGEEAVIDEVRYGPTSIIPSPHLSTPEPGRSITRDVQGTWIEVAEVTPRNSFGIVGVAPECFAGTRPEVLIRELQWQAPDGGMSSQFLELAPRGSNLTFDRLIGMRALDRDGAVIFDQQDLFGAQTGTTWLANVPYAIANVAMRTGTYATADGLLPAALDTLAGRIDLYWAAAPGVRIGLDSLIYGPTAPAVTLPPPGSSLHRTSTSQTNGSPTPMTHRLAVLTDRRYGRPDPIPIRIAEFTLQCRDGGTGRSFVELLAGGSSGTWCQDVQLEWRDRSGMLLEHIEDALAPSGSGLFPGEHWLIGPASLRSAGGHPPDRTRAMHADTLAGEVRLLAWDRHGMHVVHRSQAYGEPGVPRPLPGQSLTVTDSGIVLVDPPTARSRAYTSHSDPECRRPLTSRVRISEFQLMCTSGESRGQFVELTAMGDGEQFDSSFAIRLHDRFGFEVGRYPVTSPTASSSWPEGRGWLLAHPGYTSTSGSPDAVLLTMLDPLAGRIDLLGPSGGATVVLQSVAYGDGQPAPPPGTSLASLDGELFAVRSEPDPTSHAGRRLSATACLGPAPSYSFSEVMSQCESGEAISLIELTARVPGVAADSTLHLRIHDESGALRHEIPVHVGISGSPIQAVGTRWLMADATALARIIGAHDQAMPVSIAPAGGRLSLVRRNLLGTATLDSVAFGIGDVPTPIPGRALVRDASGDWADAMPEFTSRNGTLANSETCFDHSLADVRVIGLGIRCADGGRMTQHIQLVAEGQGLRYFSEFVVRLRDRDGALLLEIPRPFGDRTGALWMEGGTWALVSDLYQQTGCFPSPDGTFDPRMDPVAGRVEVVARYASGDRIVCELRYGGPGELPAPGPGEAIAWAADHYVIDPSPTLVSSRGQALPLDSCAPAEAPVQIVGAGIACASGSTLGQYIELRADADLDFDNRLYLEHRDSQGGLTWRSRDSFFWFDGLPWPAGQSFLLGQTDQAAALGRCVDSGMPAVLDPAGGVLELVTRRYGCREVLSRFDYRAVAAATLPGQGWRRGANGQVELDAEPRPRCSSGDSTTLVACYRAASASSAVVQELLLQTREGSTATQFVELSARGVGELFDGSVGLRTFDRDGALIQEILPEHLPSVTGLWLPGRPLLLERGEPTPTPSLRRLAALDTLAGAIEVTQRRGGGTQVLQRLSYGAGGEWPAPSLGRSIQRLADGGYSVDASPSPQSGDSARFDPLLHAGCGSASLIHPAPFGVEHVGLPSYSRDQEGMPVTLGYDLVRGRVWSTVGPNRVATSQARDSFIVWMPEPAPAAVPMLLRVRAEMTSRCDGMECGTGTVRLDWAGIGRSGSVLRESDGSSQIDFAVDVIPNVPFRLQFTLRTQSTHCRGPWESVVGVGRWMLFDLPEGAEVTSCAGYVPGDPTPVQISLLTAEAHPDRNQLAWQLGAASGAAARLERRISELEWHTLTTLLPDGLGQLRFEDFDVRAGDRREYRLRWDDPDSGAQMSPVVVLVTPAALRFALHGIHPNPAVDELDIELELAEQGSVEFEVIDIAGRRVLHHRADLTPGRRRLRLEDSRRLAAGSYVLRLRQGGSVAMRRVLITR